MRLLALLTGTLVSWAAALRNPLISGWNPDPHVLRVDDTYYIAVSSFLAYPGLPIYESKDLVNWNIISHALDTQNVIPLYGTSTDNGVWAPSLTSIDGMFYITSMAMWGSDPEHRTWPRIFWRSSPDLKTWSDVVWGEPYGIDPHLYRDPNTGKDYLTLMGLNNGYDQIWGISQCQVDLSSGKCIGPYRNVWNGTLPVAEDIRPEGPKLFYKDGYYYLLIAEGGTGATHRASIARSDSPEGPWESSPTNPLIFNGADTNLTIGATGHATFTDTPDGRWFATLLARRFVDGWSLGRETFFVPVEWDEDGWPTMNGGEYLLPSQSFDYAQDQEWPPAPLEDLFEGPELGDHWYQLRSPYTANYRIESGKGLVLQPNVFTLSDRDSPAAVLRKQISYNMTFSAAMLPTDKGLGPFQSVGVSVYASGESHMDFGLRGCADAAGLCLFVDETVDSPGPGTRPETTETPLEISTVPGGLALHVQAEFGTYSLGYSLSDDGETTWFKQAPSSSFSTAFDGMMFVLYASGNSFPWPFDAPEVGFSRVNEVYHEEHWEDTQG